MIFHETVLLSFAIGFTLAILILLLSASRLLSYWLEAYMVARMFRF